MTRGLKKESCHWKDERSWSKFLQPAVKALNSKPMQKFAGSAPNDVKESVASNDPKEKVLEFNTLKKTQKGSKSTKGRAND